MTDQFDPKTGRLFSELDTLRRELHTSIGTLRHEAIIFGVIGAIGVVLAIVGIWLEWHVHSSVGQISELGKATAEITKRVEEVHDNVTTHSLQNWPNLAQDLGLLVSDFKPGNELDIDAEIGYTHFTEPQKFRDDYFHQLHTLVANPKMNGRVLMLMPDYDTEWQSLLDQFDDESFKNMWQKDRGKFKKYCDTYPRWIGQTHFCQSAAGSIGSAKKEEFFTVLLYVENQLCDQLISAGGQIELLVRTISDPQLMPRGRRIWLLYAPVKEDPTSGMKAMIFSYPQFSWAKKGYAWKTEDRHLMEILGADFQAQFKQQYKAEVTRNKPLYGRAIEQCIGCGK